MDSYFTFADKNRIARLKAGDFIVERVDSSNTTKVLVTEKLSARYFIITYSSKAYSLVFNFETDVLFRPGLNRINKVRIRYEGLPGVIDWLEYTNAAEEWISITNLKFNGKPIERRTTNEPVDNSYLYVLE